MKSSKTPAAPGRRSSPTSAPHPAQSSGIVEVPTGLTYQGKPRTCGFRLSTLDIVVLFMATGFAAATYRVSVGYSLFVPFVVYHFFLFCNVFRIPRNPELIWGAVFLVHSAVWFLSGSPNVFLLFCLQLVVTTAIIVHEIRQPTYHGIFSRQFNPRIDDYIRGKV